jgi:hypothetical protein
MPQGPIEPCTNATAHDPLQVLALEPRQVFGEQRDAFIVRTGHACQVRAPEDVHDVLSSLYGLGIAALPWAVNPLQGAIPQSLPRRRTEPASF